MITAIHTLVYSCDPAATRAFFKDVLQWGHVTDDPDANNPASWLIFATGPSELGVHPAESFEPTSATGPSGHHQITLMCDDLDSTMADLASRGAEFVAEPRDDSFGITVALKVPGSDAIMLYQPKHTPAYNLN